ncbi:hypothetical protein L6164_025917 [Bauhinia variegata]|uniref:Uncharacterized protein n=1 Tax=Bauhinia variegata TaxID=167791 RepID=A0ACB9M3X1_BAUVA|nr:hypothetical protein L6164_025917 [Bauhinia variegata]
MIQFLTGLNDAYNTVRSNILMMSPLPNVHQAHSLVIQEETQRQMTSESTENFSIAAATQTRQSNYSSKPKNKNCTNSKMALGIPTTQQLYVIEIINLNTHGSHPSYAANAIEFSQNTHGVSSQDNNSLNTTHGFTTDQLQQLAHTLSQMTPNHTTGNDNAYVNAAGLFSSSNAINLIFTKPWILDSGATNRITTDCNLFTHTDISSIPIVKLPIGSSTFMTSTGTIPFNYNITLTKVLCIPSFHLNLISVSKIITALNCCAILFPTFCVLQDLATGKMIGSGKQHGGL